MAASRLPLLSKEDAIAKGKALGISEYIEGMNIFRVLLNHPKLAGEFNSTIISLVIGDKEISRSSARDYYHARILEGLL